MIFAWSLASCTQTKSCEIFCNKYKTKLDLHTDLLIELFRLFCGHRHQGALNVWPTPKLGTIALENFIACFKTAFVKYNLLTRTPLMYVELNLNIRMVEHKSTNFGTNASRAEYLCLAEYCLTTPLLSTYNKIIFKKKKKKKMSLSRRVLSDHPSLVNPQSNNWKKELKLR